MKRNNKKGFTIVELVIVIAVIAILSAVLIPTFGGIVDKANKSAAQQEARNKYTEFYARDLSDGEVDGMDGDTNLEELDINYVVDNGNAKFTATKNGVVATFNGSSFE